MSESTDPVPEPETLTVSGQVGNGSIVVTSLAVSLPVFSSLPPETVAWFVTLAGALRSTETSTVIDG